ncbi:hypothetical protein PRIPAC_84340 [Pristionchus pacificus]|nr:hypothetical protein PRIPAC_84340 [Pristionchus pacificus]|eukprot:PDM67425.1 hypothetical protein PRIPAC_48842 [Pristionchus pacificus]
MIDWIKWQRVKWFYCSMRESVINRSLSPSSPFLTYLNRIHPLHPIVVAHSMQPFVFSPQYAVSELADGLVHYLSRKNVLRQCDYVVTLVNTMNFMGGLLKNEDSRIKLPQMEKVLVALLPILTDYNIGEERKKSVFSFQSLILSFHSTYQPLLLKRLVRLIKDHTVKVDAEAQILSFIVDLYRQQFVVKGHVNEDYSLCLSEFWSTIFIKYEDCSQASMFYQSLFLLAGLQARICHRLDLLKNVQVKVLTPLQQQLSDYLQLRKLQEKTDIERANIDLSFIPPVNCGRFSDSSSNVSSSDERYIPTHSSSTYKTQVNKYVID